MEENLNELIKTDNATILNFEKDKQPKPIKFKIIKPKPVFGTKEWADRSENCLNGCSHDCKYCYAKATAVRFGHNTAQNWKNESLKPDILKKEFRKFKGKIMFPTAHDITPAHLDDCMTYLENMLRPGNQVTIVAKPHLDCVKAICQEFAWYKDKILFRFTIGSSDSDTLKFWEPNAPDFAFPLKSSSVFVMDLSACPERGNVGIDCPLGRYSADDCFNFCFLKCQNLGSICRAQHYHVEA